MKKPIYAIILAGGRGERFWPSSTQAVPKQFLSLTGKESLLSMSVKRILKLVPSKNIFVITNHSHVQLARMHARGIPPKNVIGEPMGRDTAAACALGWAIVSAREQNGATVYVLTADHVIGDEKEFISTLKKCARVAQSGKMVTIGIKPFWPSTGFGYIRAGKSDKTPNGVAYRNVDRFVEKPDADTARRYLRSKALFWNSGMLTWTTECFSSSLKQYTPTLHRMAMRLQKMSQSAHLRRALVREYSGIERISVDYAILEKAGNVAIVEGDFGWDDLGTWTAVRSYLKQDEEGNAWMGKGCGVDSTGNTVISKKRFTALMGVKDIIVVHSDNATLICSREKAQDMKKLVKKISETEGTSGLL